MREKIMKLQRSPDHASPAWMFRGTSRKSAFHTRSDPQTRVCKPAKVPDSATPVVRRLAVHTSQEAGDGRGICHCKIRTMSLLEAATCGWEIPVQPGMSRTQARYLSMSRIHDWSCMLTDTGLSFAMLCRSGLLLHHRVSASSRAAPVLV